MICSTDTPFWSETLDMDQCVDAHFEGSRPELCISSMLYSGDVPFWAGTLNFFLWVQVSNISRVPDQNGVSQAWFIVQIQHSGRKPLIWISVLMPILRVPDQNCVSQACYIVEIYHSGREPSISSFGSKWVTYGSVCWCLFGWPACLSNPHDQRKVHLNGLGLG